MATGNERNLADALMLLTRVSIELDKKLTKVEKVLGSLSNVGTNQKVKTDKVIPENYNIEKKPEEVVEKPKETIITSFGRDAENFLSKLLKERQPSEKPEKEDKEKESSSLNFIKKYLPLGLMSLGLLGGLMESITKGKLKDFFKKLQEGDFEGAFKSAYEVIETTLTPVAYSLPIIGPALAIISAINKFKEGDNYAAAVDVLSAIIAFLPLPMSLKSAVIGVVRYFAEEYKQKAEEEGGATLNPDGINVLNIGAILAKASVVIGNQLYKVFKFGSKRVPILGSLINFAEGAKLMSSSENAVDMGIGLTKFISGIINLVPGYGTIISLGLDILTELLFKTEYEVTPDGGIRTKVSVREWATPMFKFIKDAYPIKNLIEISQGLYELKEGNNKGILRLFKWLPGVGMGYSGFGTGFDLLVTLLEKGEKPSENQIVTSEQTNKESNIWGSLTKALKYAIYGSLIKLLPGPLQSVAYSVLFNEEEPKKPDITQIQNPVGKPGTFTPYRFKNKSDTKQTTNEWRELMESQKAEREDARVSSNVSSDSESTKLLEVSNNTQNSIFELNNTLEDFAKKNNVLAAENNNITKFLGERELEMQSKTLELMDKIRVILENQKPQATNNNVVSLPQFNYSGSTGASTSLRQLQNAPTY
jgi:hypothetical protein